MAHERAIGESLIKSEGNVIGSWNKGGFWSVAMEGLAILSPAVTWKIENIFNEMVV